MSRLVYQIWHISTSESDIRAFDVQFHPEGRLLDFEDECLRSGTTWQQQKRTLTLVFNEYSTWVGTMAPKLREIEGTASNQDNRKWTWKAELKEIAKKSHVGQRRYQQPKIPFM